ncbi:chemotaxis protein CheV [Acidihalobacter prosperus]|uniref:Chemotaxis protein CheW n=1 Tax=Acidihalobacter prosperus TaxID=160660 RepID=A0A1A6C5G7_9GAMM|nr:chemotaxis protein CheV [Acidihalobacter prosperus]OBS09790.1 chemotaxis protein CheW [Acidihalobacter prosperus]
MTDILTAVDKRTRLAGQNRLELLLFRLDRQQIFAINVFKVREIIPLPKLKGVPQAHPYVLGIANIRGRPTSIIEVARPLGRRGVAAGEESFVIVTEFNRSVQGFRVASVERIINISWESVLPPPKGSRSGHYMTAVTQYEDQLIEILDVERILADVQGVNTDLSDDIREKETGNDDTAPSVLVADDSSVARLQVRRTLEQLGMQVTLANDGREALDKLEAIAASGGTERGFDMIVSDIEMPRMDGYTLCSRIRADKRMADMPVILHTSLSGSFNQAMVDRVGATAFLPKFQPNEFAETILKVLHEHTTQGR